MLGRALRAGCTAAGGSGYLPCRASSSLAMPANVTLAAVEVPVSPFTAVDFSAPGAMELPVWKLGDAAAPAGTADLSRAIFANEPRVDILHDVVRWQRAKMRRGTAFVKNRAEVSGTGKKPFNQKGTGRARSGSLRTPQYRGGGKAHGPRNKDWSHSLNKKYRRLGLIHALSAKHQEGKLWLLQDLLVDTPKTKGFADALDAHAFGESVLIIDPDTNENALTAARNLRHCQVMEPVGANVLSILKADSLALTLAGLQGLSARLQAELVVGAGINGLGDESAEEEDDEEQ